MSLRVSPWLLLALWWVWVPVPVGAAPLMTGAAQAAPATPPDAPQVAYGPRGKRVLTVADGTLRVWSTAGQPTPEAVMGCAAPIESASFLPDGDQILVGHGPVEGVTGPVGQAGTAVLPVTGGEAVRRWPGLLPVMGKDGPLMSRSGRLVLGRRGDRFRLLYLNHGGMGSVIHHPGVTRVALSPDARFLLTGDATGKVILWQTRNGRQRRVRRLGGPVTTLGFSFDGNYALDGSEAASVTGAASGTGSGSTIWSVPGGAVAFTSDDPHARLSPADPYLLEGRGSGVVLRQLPTGTSRCTWSHGIEQPGAADFTLGGNRVWARGATQMKSWRVPGCETDRHADVVPLSEAARLYFTPDGSQALTVAEGSARLWVFPSRKRPDALFKNWSTSNDVPYPVRFAPNGAHLITATGSRRARLVSLPDGGTESTLVHGTDQDRCIDDAVF